MIQHERFQHIMRDVFNLYDGARDNGADAEKWTQTAQKALNISERYGNETFVLNLLASVYLQFSEDYTAADALPPGRHADTISINTAFDDDERKQAFDDAIINTATRLLKGQ